MKITYSQLLEFFSLCSLGTAATTLDINSPNEYVNAVYFSQWSFPNTDPFQIPLSHVTHIFYAFADIDTANTNIKWVDEEWEVEKEIPVNISTLVDDTTDLKYLNISDNVNAGEYNRLPWISDYLEESDILIKQSNENSHNLKVKGTVGQLKLLRQSNPRLKISLSIGGSKSFHKFRAVATSKKVVKAFAANVAENIHRLGFDGVDIDWEFPSNQHDRQMLTYLVKHLYKRFNKLAEYPEERKIITLAIPVDTEVYKYYDFAALEKFVSYYNLMGYDMSGTWSTLTSLQSNLYTDPKLKASPISVDNAMKSLKELVNKSKILLGMPLYGRSFNTDRLYSPFSGCANIESVSMNKFDDVQYKECIISYSDLPPSGYTEYSDIDLGAAYAYKNDTDDKGIIFYDTPVISKQKARYVIDNGLGGGMWWDAQGDTFLTNSTRSLIYNFVDELGGISKLITNVTNFHMDDYKDTDIVSVSLTDDDYKDNTASKHSTGKYILLYIAFINIFIIFI
ncbi:putative chitinase [Pichia kluyveri]|uniref:chitinase n=1 Tax=Pichia kluyveri TaxID=36015 RepID=A0AAV5QZM7_PICKL|nr:putative chitinase [Pichia kluyveri]